MRYIIGLTPKVTLPYVAAAQELFSDVSDGYLLADSVYPHITLVQFETVHSSQVKLIWEEIASNHTLFQPQLIGINFIKGLGEHSKFYWAQIGVERDPILMSAHHQMVDLLKHHQLDCLIDSGDIYKPHITLARIKLLKSIPMWPMNILEPSFFNITIGESDKNGRYLNKVELSQT